MLSLSCSSFGEIASHRADNDSKILPIYFVALMTWFASRFARLKRGQEDAYTFMSTGSLGELQIPLPPFPLQQKFAALMEQVEPG